MWKKKITGIILAVALALSTAACGTPADKELSGTAAASGLQSQGESEPENSGDKPEPVRLVVEVYDRGNMPEDYGDPTDNKWVNIIQEKVKEELNIELEFMAIPRSEDTTKVQALMAAHNEPDLFYIYDVNTFLTWAGDGALADLTDYMEEDGAQVRSILGEDILSYGLIDGRQYAIPARRNDVSMLSSFIRKDWLEQLGIEIADRNGNPSMTPDELFEAMVKIKEAGLCEYPMGLLNDFTSIQPVEGAFIDASVPASDEGKATVIDDFFLTAAGDKEAYRFLNKCYNAGLISPDFAVYKSEDMGERISAGQCAFWSAAYWTYMGKDSNIAALYDAEPEAEILAMEVCREDESPALYQEYMPIGAYCMISSGCENVGAALRFIGWLVGEEAHTIICHGTQGEHWEYNEAGLMVAIDPEYNNKDRVSVGDLDVMLNNDPCLIGEFGAEVFRMGKENSNDPRTVDLTVNAKAIGESEGKWPKLYIDRQLTAVSDYAAELKENRDNVIINSIMADEAEFDSIFDEYYNVYLQEGAKQAMEEQLDAVK